MEANKLKNRKIYDPQLNNPLPRPIRPRECECGCGYFFQPSRRDKIYLNKQHADFAYNHGKRKTKNKQRINEEKILNKNDDILAMHFKAERNIKQVDRYYDTIKAEGFKFGYHVGKYEEKDTEYYYTYNYYYRIFYRNSIKMIKIFKR